MSLLHSPQPLLLITDSPLFLGYVPILVYRMESCTVGKMEVVKWFWVSGHVQVLHLPVAIGPIYCPYLQIQLLDHLEIPYQGCLSGRAVVERLAEENFPLGSPASSCSACSPFGSSMSTSAAQDRKMYSFNTSNRKNRYDSFGFVKEHPESYKDLDFEDTVFIPNFCADDQPEPAHAAANGQFGPEPSSRVLLPHVKPSTPAVIAPQADVWQPRSQHGPVAVNKNALDISTLTPSTATIESNHSLNINLPNQRGSHSNQSTCWGTPPSSNTPQTPSPRTLGGCSGTSQHTNIIAREIKAQQERNRLLGSGTSRSFIPSRVAQEKNSSASTSPAPSARNAIHYGRADLPANENCAIYIVGIPATAKYADVLGSIRGGKIYICLIDPPSKQHPTAAAKIVFFTRASAELFMQRDCGVGVYILGQRVRAMWNRIHYPAHARPHQSRVIHISGPTRWMNFEYFENFFRGRLEFQEESRSEVMGSREGQVVHVWRFASLRAQAALAFIAIERELSGIFRVEYGPDPCAQPWMQLCPVLEANVI